jgi:hypothetical protein
MKERHFGNFYRKVVLPDYVNVRYNYGMVTTYNILVKEKQLWRTES